MSGFVAPDSGRVRFRGHELTGRPPHEIVALGMARTFQHLGLFYQLSVWDNVFLALPNKRRERLWGTFLPHRLVREEERRLADRTAEILDFLGLRDRAGEQVARPRHGATRSSCASGGSWPRTVISCSWTSPRQGSRTSRRRSCSPLLRALVARGKTVLIIDHNMEAIMDVSDHIIVLDYGRILAAGAPADIRANEDVIRAYLGA